jgi:hypothetical protein
MQRFCLLLLTVALIARSLHAQSSASLTVPEFVKAGEPVNVVGILDRAPNFDGSSVLYYITGPDGNMMQSSVEIKRGQSKFEFTYVIPYPAKGGTWAIADLRFNDGINPQIPLKAEPRTFTVIANKGLIYPQAAQIDLRPSQVQLLRGEGLRLQTEIQNLKEKIRQSRASALPQILATNIENEIRAIDKIQATYQQLGTDDRQAIQNSITFFSDIKTSYTEARRLISGERAKYSPASFTLNSHVSKEDVYPAIAQVTLRAFEHNERAYETAASAETLAFDLKVTSSPPGAVISYRRRGDDTYAKASEPTNATVPSLIYAIWIVRVEILNPYSCQEIEHNAVNESYHVLHFDLSVNQKCK